MDRETIAAYDRDAADFAEQWQLQPTPTDLHDIVRRYFQPGPTADIGCGSGRDTAWLNENGFPAVGYDPSEGLLAVARRRYPGVRFELGALPRLEGIADGQFNNVLCETVLMHLDRAVIRSAVARLQSIVKPAGTLSLSWRVTLESDRRDARGRLYSVVTPAAVLPALGDAEVLLNEPFGSVSSGKAIHRLVARKRS